MPPLLDPTSNEQKHSKLTTAALIGATTETSTRLWVRVYREGAWTLVVTTAPLAGDLVRLNEQSITAFLAAQGITPIFVQEQQITQESNLTKVYDVTGLQAGTTYYYALIANETAAAVIPRRTEIGSDFPHSFRTLPAAGEGTVFGFWSCHDHISSAGDAGAWPHFAEQLHDARAQFVIGGGDQVYVDTNKQNDFLDIWTWLKDNKAALLAAYATGSNKYDEAGIELYLLNIYRWYYRVYWSVPALRHVFERYPQFMIWDDHEIMDGWGSLTWKERTAQISGFFEETDTKTNRMLVDLMWKAACRAYNEYQHSHNPATPGDIRDPDNCQWDYSFRQGDCAFYVLDMRGHHDVEKNKGKKKEQQDGNIILGQAQFDRLSAWLNGPEVAQAQALFVVSPVPVIHWIDGLVNFADLGESKDDFMDEWGHKTNWQERNQMLDTVFGRISATGKKLVFLSGDVHSASAFRLRHRAYPAASVHQITSSAISRKPAPAISRLGISSSGPMDGHKEVICEQLYAMAGSKNFLMVRVHVPPGGGPAEIVVDIHWPGGSEGEVTKRRLVLG